MLNRCFNFIFFLLTVPAFAQPDLDTSYFPKPGKTFSGRSFSRTLPLPAIEEGANKTWDLTGLAQNYITDYSFSFRMKNASNLDSAVKFPGATSGYVSFFGTDSIENFQKINGNDLEDLGYNLKGVAISERFSIPRVLLRKNIEFQESFVQQSRSVNSTAGFKKYNRYRDTITYAGFGTLITTFGTYQNVILIKRFFSIDVAFEPNAPLEMGYLGQNWFWYIQGYGLPFVEYKQEVDLFVPDEIIYDGYVGFIPPPVANNPTLFAKNLSLVPSIIDSEREIMIAGLNSDVDFVQIFNSKGQLVCTAKVQNQKFRIPKLPSGIYSVLGKSETIATVLKLVIR